MNATDYLVSCQEPEQPYLGLAPYEISFLFAKTPRQLNLHWLSEHPGLLDFLVASVAKQPRDLVTHVQRICLCYQRNLSEHLYGAMVDLFCVLDGHAGDFCGRLLDKVLPKLQAPHAYLLNQYLDDKNPETLFMVQNSFTVLGKGLLGTANLVAKQVSGQHQEKSVVDPLQLARDYIEYSQFQEAKAVLESAILAMPAREELHQDILELYKSLQDVAGFSAMQALLAQQGNSFPGLWHELENYFQARKLL